MTQSPPFRPQHLSRIIPSPPNTHPQSRHCPPLNESGYEKVPLLCRTPYFFRKTFDTPTTFSRPCDAFGRVILHPGVAEQNESINFNAPLPSDFSSVGNTATQTGETKYISRGIVLGRYQESWRGCGPIEGEIQCLAHGNQIWVMKMRSVALFMTILSTLTSPFTRFRSILARSCLGMVHTSRSINTYPPFSNPC